MSRVTSNGWSVGIRGFGNIFSKSVLVLIDGRSVYTPLFEGVYWDMQNVMLQDVDRIEVIRGPGGTIWGSNAVNGVINIITKNAKETHGALASVGGGNVDQGTGMFRYGGSVRQNFNYRVYGMGFTRGPEFHPDANEFDGWRMGQVGFRTDWTHGRRDSFMVEGDAYRGEIGQLNNIAFYAPPSQANIDNEAFVSGGSLVWTWRRQLRRDSDFHVEAYFDRTNRQDLQFGETRDTFDIDFVDDFKLPGSQDFIRMSGSHAGELSGAIAAFRARVYRAAAWSSYALLVALLFAPSLCAQQVKTTEYQVKAAYLYNFGLFVTWPAAGKFSPELFGICVLGKDPFGPILDSTFAGETLNGRAIAVRRIADARDAHSCGILFISRSEAKKLNAILLALGNAAILTVSDIPDFSQHGGMIEFVWGGDNVRFEVNLTAADAAGLTLSSDLLKVATAVRRNTPSGL